MRRLVLSINKETLVGKGLLAPDEAAAYMGVAQITLRSWTRHEQRPCE